MMHLLRHTACLYIQTSLLDKSATLANTNSRLYLNKLKKINNFLLYYYNHDYNYDYTLYKHHTNVYHKYRKNTTQMYIKYTQYESVYVIILTNPLLPLALAGLVGESSSNVLLVSLTVLSHSLLLLPSINIYK